MPDDLETLVATRRGRAGRERWLGIAIAVVLVADLARVVTHGGAAGGAGQPAAAASEAAANALADRRWAAGAALVPTDLGEGWELDASTGATGRASLVPRSLSAEEGSPECGALDEAGKGASGFTEHGLSSSSAHTLVFNAVAVYADEPGARAAFAVLGGAAYRACLLAAYERLAQGAVDALDRGPLELTVTAEERPVAAVDGDVLGITLVAAVRGPAGGSRIEMDVVAVRRGRAIALLACNLDPDQIPSAQLAAIVATRMGQGPPPG